eukprot:6886451-Prymnesium_polylepis.1
MASEVAMQKYLTRVDDFDCAIRNRLPIQSLGSYLVSTLVHASSKASVAMMSPPSPTSSASPLAAALCC